MPPELFDDWPERYDDWFRTPIGKLVRQAEGELVDEMLAPGPGERILDAGCGTGVFMLDFLRAGAEVVGLDVSAPMLRAAVAKTRRYRFSAVLGDMLSLPFRGDAFDKSVSVTALEFIADGRRVVGELFRVTRPGGLVVVATLNSLSPWAARRRAKTARGERHVLEGAFYRSPADLLACAPVPGVARTAVHFLRDNDPDKALEVERTGNARGVETGAFVIARWQKPA
jgi:ubiquinone/menaquinone biosynthesis C-methylase UbiE